MKLRDIYKTTDPVFSFEFFPPKTEKGTENLFKHVEVLKKLSPSFFSVTYGAGGSTREKTLTLGHEIFRRSGVETMCHLTCVGQSKDEIRALIQEMKKLGMENVMALRGDPPQGEENWEPHPDGFHYASELVSEIRATADMSIAVAGFPEVHPESENRESDLKRLKEKVECGADVVVTQCFYENEYFFKFDRDLKAMGVEVPIIPGIMPFLSAQQIRNFTTALSKTAIPSELGNAIDKVAEDPEATRRLSIEYATRQIQALLDYGVKGVHIYCLNRSFLSKKIFENLGLV